jgi:hypothetical protein
MSYLESVSIGVDFKICERVIFLHFKHSRHKIALFRRHKLEVKPLNFSTEYNPKRRLIYVLEVLY